MSNNPDGAVNIDFLNKRVKRLKRQCQAGDPLAIQRIRMTRSTAESGTFTRTEAGTHLYSTPPDGGR